MHSWYIGSFYTEKTHSRDAIPLANQIIDLISLVRVTQLAQMPKRHKLQYTIHHRISAAQQASTEFNKEAVSRHITTSWHLLDH